ncbi:DNA-binding CsgD family transcriptional regulator [Mycobacterium sp. OAS707]|uniref:ATP-binding protein n=1 Tax=Mycobacterium sp. OAS707 TaxID=2663822 RepID=UPI00178AF1A0|nr:DNA-binding CsgD family transcriptional regulator [Mycobacterium sp. OAS707]
MVAELIEREGQLAAGAALIRQALEGVGNLLIVEGLAGTGKTRLLTELVAIARAQPMAILTAAGGELEMDVTYGIARQLFERRLHDAPAAERHRLLSGAAKLAQAAVVPDTDVEFSPATGVDHGLYWLVANIESDGPLVLVVDDAQWADAESLRFLLYLARRVGSLRVLIVVAIRTGELPADPALIRHLRAQAVRTIVVEPLSEAGSEALLRARFDGALPTAVARACHRVSGGNPFFLGQVADALPDAQGVDERALIERVDTLVPDEVRVSILLRLSRIGDDARRLAEALAVAGDGVSAQVLAAMVQRPVPATAGMLDDLVRAGIAAPGEPARVVHPVVRTAIYHDIRPDRREWLHAAAAAALRAAAAPVEEVAHHLGLTSPAGDEGVASTLRAAGERALARGATQTATAMLRRALTEPPAPADLAAVLVALGESEFRSGANAETLGHLEQALQLRPDSQLSVRAAVTLASALFAQGRVGEAFSALEREGRRIGGAGTLRLDTERVLLANWIRDSTQPPWRDALLADFRRLQGATPEERFALVQAAIGQAFDPGSDSESAAALARRAIGDGALIAEFPVDNVGGAQATYVLVMAEDLEVAETEIAALLARARERGSVAELLQASMLAGQVALARGRLASAAADFEVGLNAALSLGESPIAHRSIAFASSWLIEALLGRGQVDAARKVLEGVQALDAFERHELVWARAGRGWVRLLVDQDADGAAADFLAFGDAALAGGYEERGALWRLWAAQALAAAGAGERAAALADEQLTIARAWGAPGGLGMALRVRAAVDPYADGGSTLDRAIASLRDSAYRLELARALVDRGRLLRRDGRRVAARSLFEEGMELGARCEAAPLVEAARAELVVLGARPRRLMVSGVEALTAAERRVADLAATGLANREIAQTLFVTEKTIEAHLHRVFRKLAIRSRRQLPTLLAEAGP